jgi:hypothetical protein
VIATYFKEEREEGVLTRVILTERMFIMSITDICFYLQNYRRMMEMCH